MPLNLFLFIVFGILAGLLTYQKLSAKNSLAICVIAGIIGAGLGGWAFWILTDIENAGRYALLSLLAAELVGAFLLAFISRLIIIRFSAAGQTEL
jgi:uncharacterized membrane protein YeaQ/YmgE (transglycosylase-associated protein family)